MKKSKAAKKKGFNIPGMKSMRCPYCGSKVHLRSADGIYKNNNENTNLFVCSQYPVCDSYVRVHSETEIPVGSVANAKLRALRVTAHHHFDNLHKSGLMTKKEAYTWLAFMLQSPMSQAHIGYLNEYYCNRIIKESDRIFDNMKWKLNRKSRYEPEINGGEYYAQ
jgi:ssDNA-binding Zn-finger/Zn-ribbon topoisomerase 1